MDKDKKHRKYRLHDISTIALIFSVVIFIFSRTQADADLWGHLRFGLDFLETLRISQVDPYSYLSAGQRWINHEWLAEVLFAITWLAGSSAGLILLKTTAGVLSLGLIYGYLLKCNLSSIRAGSLVILSSLAVFRAIATVRPWYITQFSNFARCLFAALFARIFFTSNFLSDLTFLSNFKNLLQKTRAISLSSRQRHNSGTLLALLVLVLMVLLSFQNLTSMYNYPGTSISEVIRHIESISDEDDMIKTYKHDPITIHNQHKQFPQNVGFLNIRPVQL